MQLRPAANEPQSQPNCSHATAQRPQRADFLHPGYPGRTVFLSLPALDDDDDDDDGIDFDTALRALRLLRRPRDGAPATRRRGRLMAFEPIRPEGPSSGPRRNGPGCGKGNPLV